jgi:hypothetical protein
LNLFGLGLLIWFIEIIFNLDLVIHLIDYFF